jgi:pantoate--beta-alanine ligase
MPELIRDPREMQSAADLLRRSGKHIAVVPTMGALHEGHLSLVRIARTRADVVVVTIFVNPTQFGPGEDFARYPRPLERDLALAHEAGAERVFVPSASEMYPAGFETFVSLEETSKVLEGASRPGHFRGVATVVTKLLNLTKPHVAVFGQKDAQQVAVIRRLVRDLNIDCEIVVGPTVREPDGLAMSSRNVYLTPEERQQAPVLYRSLQLAGEMIRNGERDAETIRSAIADRIRAGSQGKIDYISIAGADDLRELQKVKPGLTVLVSLAVRFGGTRLIDNSIVTPS